VAAAQNLPFTARKLTPTLDDTFWVNLIGRGYPAPNDNFR
jgi:DNA sulfur modification protein DndC